MNVRCISIAAPVGSRNCFVCQCRVAVDELEPTIRGRTSSRSPSTPLLRFICSDEQLSGSGSRSSSRFRSTGLTPCRYDTCRFSGSQLTWTHHWYVQQQRGRQRRICSGRQSATIQLSGHCGQPGSPELQSGKSSNHQVHNHEFCCFKIIENWCNSFNFIIYTKKLLIEPSFCFSSR